MRLLGKNVDLEQKQMQLVLVYFFCQLRQDIDILQANICLIGYMLPRAFTGQILLK